MNNTEIKSETNGNQSAKHIKCPKCAAALVAAEITEQQCFTCGWPEDWDAEIDDETED